MTKSIKKFDYQNYYLENLTPKMMCLYDQTYYILILFSQIIQHFLSHTLPWVLRFYLNKKNNNLIIQKLLLLLFLLLLLMLQITT